MDVFISRNGENSGPFSLEEIRSMISSGEASEDDHGWHDGMDAWGPLSKLLAVSDPLPSSPPPPPEDSRGPSLPQPTAPPRSSKLRPPGSLPPAATERHPDADARLRTPDVIVRETVSPDPKHKRGVVVMPEQIHIRKSHARDLRFGYLRLLAVPAIALMLYSMFLPWAYVEDADGGIFSRATAAELSLAEELGNEPLGIENPKTLPHFGRLLMVCALLGALVISLLCLKLAFRQEGVIPFGALIVAIATTALVGILGILYGVQMENQTDTIITMDVGYYFALGIAVFTVAMVLVPEVGRANQLVTLFVPPAIVIAGAIFLVFYGFGIGQRAATAQAQEEASAEEEDAPVRVLKAPGEVIAEIKAFYGEVTG